MKKGMKIFDKKSKNGMAREDDGPQQVIKYLMRFKTAIAFFILPFLFFILGPWPLTTLPGTARCPTPCYP